MAGYIGFRGKQYVRFGSRGPEKHEFLTMDRLLVDYIRIKARRAVDVTWLAHGPTEKGTQALTHHPSKIGGDLFKAHLL